MTAYVASPTLLTRPSIAQTRSAARWPLWTAPSIQPLSKLSDTSLPAMEKLEAIVHETAREAAERHRAKVEITRVLATAPTPMDGALQRAIAAAATKLGAAHQSLPSGAGHDALVLARHVPSAMLFVPSIGGRSHHVSEDTSENDIETGANVLLEAVTQYLASIG